MHNCFDEHLHIGSLVQVTLDHEKIMVCGYSNGANVLKNWMINLGT